MPSRNQIRDQARKEKHNGGPGCCTRPTVAAPPSKPDLQAKLHERRKVLKEVRTNTCSKETVANLTELDPKLQMQVLRQMQTKKATTTGAKTDGKSGGDTKSAGDTKSRGTQSAGDTKSEGKLPAKKKKRATPKKAPETSVTQSTEETNQTIASVKSKILLAAIEKQMEDLFDVPQLDPQLKEQAANGLGILKSMLSHPELAGKINQQIHQWSSQGSVPNKEHITRFLQEITAIYKKSCDGTGANGATGVPRQYKFDHDAGGTTDG